jgi:hypothetical protein
MNAEKKLAYDQQLKVPSAADTKTPVDLFVYVNAATSHRMTYKALDDWKRICADQPATPGCAADPMYLATSSRTDFATSFLLPFANLIAPAFKADRLHLISAANTPWLHTHHDPKKMGAACPTPPRPSPGTRRWKAPCGLIRMIGLFAASRAKFIPANRTSSC